MPRVAMLVHAYYVRDARVQREAECLAKAGYEVHVVCCREPSTGGGFRESSNQVINEVYIHRVRLGKKRGTKFRYFFEYTMLMLLGMWKLAILHLKRSFDVVHIHNMPDLLVLSGLIPKWTGAILVLDIHDPMNEMFQNTYHIDEAHPMIRILKLQEWISYRLASHLLTVSIPMAENVAEKAGYAGEAVKVVHNFPDLSKFPIRENGRNWPYNRDTIVFLYCGTVTEHYRLDIAVRAFAVASQTVPNIKLRILGSGNRLQHVLCLATELGIADRVEHLEAVAQEKVIDIMAGADVGISTHQSGTFADLYFSTKIIEFMTQGLPVLSSRTYTIEKYIPEDSIFYFEPGQIDDLIKQIILICRNPHLVNEKVRNSKRLLTKCSWEAEKGELLSFYQELIKQDQGILELFESRY